MKNFLRRRWKSTTYVLCVLILGAYVYFLLYPVDNGNMRQIESNFAQPLSFEYSSSTDCTITDSSGVYSMLPNSNGMSPVQVRDWGKDSGVKFTFNKLNEANVQVLIADAVNVQDETAIKVADNDEVIHLVGNWGMTKEDIVTYSIYKKSGFFTYTRSGNLMLIGDSVVAQVGTCI